MGAGLSTSPNITSNRLFLSGIMFKKWSQKPNSYIKSLPKNVKNCSFEGVCCLALRASSGKRARLSGFVLPAVTPRRRPPAHAAACSQNGCFFEKSARGRKIARNLGFRRVRVPVSGPKKFSVFFEFSTSPNIASCWLPT